MIRKLRILFFAILSGLVLYVVVLAAVQPSMGPPELTRFKNLLFLIVASMTALCLLMAQWLFKKFIEPARPSIIPLHVKLSAYRRALIVYMAVCEGPGLFAGVVFLVTGDPLLLLIPVASIATMTLKYPTLERIVKDLDLDWVNQQQLE